MNFSTSFQGDPTVGQIAVPFRVYAPLHQHSYGQGFVLFAPQNTWQHRLAVCVEAHETKQFIYQARRCLSWES